MKPKPKIAFYAPLKPPDHPVPSGDREMARLMASALERAGYRVEIASRFIAYQREPDGDVFREIREAARAEAVRLAGGWLRSAEKPDLWLTYHPYCKAPDWIGPAVATALSIPYVTAEACRTRQGGDADWREGRQAVQAAARMATVNFCLKPADQAYLRSFLPETASIVPLRPFLDLSALAAEVTPIDPRPSLPGAAPLIVSVGMMRPGVKISSYRLLAEALSGLTDLPWSLVVIGDGPARAEVEAMFAFAHGDRRQDEAPPRGPLCPAGHLPHTGEDQPSFRASPISGAAELEPAEAAGPISPLGGEMSGRTEGADAVNQISTGYPTHRVHFTGALPRSEVLGWMQAGDLFAWPGIGEAFGMAYLEAQAAGLPVAACDTAGVPVVVAAGETGLLAPPSAEAYRTALRRLLSSAAERKRMAAAGPQRIAALHDIPGAAAAMKTALDPLLRRNAALWRSGTAAGRQP